jgi:hypothetical protein
MAIRASGRSCAPTAEKSGDRQERVQGRIHLDEPRTHLAEEVGEFQSNRRQ